MRVTANLNSSTAKKEKFQSIDFTADISGVMLKCQVGLPITEKIEGQIVFAGDPIYFALEKFNLIIMPSVIPELQIDFS